MLISLLNICIAMVELVKNCNNFNFEEKGYTITYAVKLALQPELPRFPSWILSSFSHTTINVAFVM